MGFGTDSHSSMVGREEPISGGRQGTESAWHVTVSLQRLLPWKTGINTVRKDCTSWCEV